MKKEGRRVRVKEDVLAEAEGKTMQLALNIEGRHKSRDGHRLWKLGKVAKICSSIEPLERNVP